MYLLIYRICVKEEGLHLAHLKIRLHFSADILQLCNREGLVFGTSINKAVLYMLKFCTCVTEECLHSANV